jgi:hypothetical protein
LPFRGRLLSGVMRACRGSTRPSHLGQRSNSPARFPLQETVGAFGQQQGNGVKNHRMHSRGVLFGESLHEARVEEQAAKHVPGTRRSSDLIERWGVSRGTQLKIRCSTEKRRSHREMVVGTLRVNPSHTVERGAGWLRSEDLAMSGVRELRLCSKKETRLRSRAGLEGDYRTDQQSCTKGISWERATSSGGRLDASGHGIESHSTAGMRRAGDLDLIAKVERSSEDLRTGWNARFGVKARVRAVSFGRSWETRHGVLVDGEEEMPRTARMIGCNDAS